VLGKGGVCEFGDEVGEGRDEDVEDGNPEFAAVEDGHGVSSPYEESIRRIWVVEGGKWGKKGDLVGGEDLHETNIFILF